MLLHHGLSSTLALALLIIFMPSSANCETTQGVINLGSNSRSSISPSGKVLAYWKPGNSYMQLLATDTGKESGRLELGEGEELQHLAFCKADGRLCGVTTTGKVYFWAGRVAPEVIQLELETDQKLFGAMRLSDSGTQLVEARRRGAGNSNLAAWALPTGKSMKIPRMDEVIEFAWSADERRLFLVQRSGAAYWEKDAEDLTPLDGEFQNIQAVEISPTGRYLACASTADRIFLIDTNSGDSDYVESSPNAQVTFSSDGTRLVVAQGKEKDLKIEVWSLGSALKDLTFEREYRGSRALPIAVGQSKLVYVTYDDDDTLFVDDFLAGSPTQSIGSETTYMSERDVTMLGISPGGDRVLLGTSANVIVAWLTNVTINGFDDKEAQRRRRIQIERSDSRCAGAVRLPSPPVAAQFVGDKGSFMTTLIDGDTYLVVGPSLFPDTGGMTLRYRPWLSYGSREIHQVDFSPKGDRVAVALAEGLSIVDAKTGKEIQFYDKSCFVARFDSRGDRVFCLGKSQHGIANLTTATYTPMASFGETTIATADPRFASGFVIDRKNVVVEASTGRAINRFQGDMVQGGLASVSDNGKFFFMVGSGRGGRQTMMELFDIDGTKPLISMESDLQGYMGCQILSDGRTGIIANRNRVAIYDLRRRRLERALPDDRYRDEEQKQRIERDGAKVDHYFMLNKAEMLIDAIDVHEPTGRIVLAERSRVSVWDIKSGDLIWLGDLVHGDVASVAFSPDANRIAVGKKNGELHIQDISVTR